MRSFDANMWLTSRCLFSFLKALNLHFSIKYILDMNPDGTNNCNKTNLKEIGWLLAWLICDSAIVYIVLGKKTLFYPSFAATVFRKLSMLISGILTITCHKCVEKKFNSSNKTNLEEIGQVLTKIELFYSCVNYPRWRSLSAPSLQIFSCSQKQYIWFLTVSSYWNWKMKPYCTFQYNF